MNIYAYAGGISLSNRYEVTGRVMLRFVMPGLDTKTSLNVGFNYMKHFVKNDVDKYLVVLSGYKPEEQTTIDMYSIPVTIQYNITKGIIQPFVNGGVSLDYKQETNDQKVSGIVNENKAGISLIAAAGIDGKVSKNFAIRGEWLIQYELGSDLLIHYPTIGVVVSFR